MFSSALGLTQADADILRDALLAAAREDNAVPGNSDEYGERYTIDFQIEHGGRLAPGVYEVEFSDDEGRPYASLALRTDQLLQLHHKPSHQAA